MPVNLPLSPKLTLLVFSHIRPWGNLTYLQQQALWADRTLTYVFDALARGIPCDSGSFCYFLHFVTMRWLCSTFPVQVVKIKIKEQLHPVPN